MKQRIRIKRKDGIQQRYWVGRRLTDPSGYSDSPYFLQESSAKSAEYISARKHKVPEKLINFRFRELFKNE